MAKSSNKKVTKKIKKRIVELHQEGKDINEISMQLYQENVDLSYTTINKIVNEYYDSIGEKRTRKAVSGPKMVYTIEEIEEQLIHQLKKGRPAEDVFRVAQKVNALTETLLSEINKNGYNPQVKEEEENEKWMKWK